MSELRAAKELSNDLLVYYEDWSEGRVVELEDQVPPADISQLIISDIQATSVTLSWHASPSLDVAYYEIYQDQVLIGTTTDTVYKVSQLSPDTTYELTVKAVDQSHNKSEGIGVEVLTESLILSLYMNGTTDYVKTPPLKFDSIRMEFASEAIKGRFAAYIDASAGIGNATFGRNSSGLDFMQSAWKSVVVDGIDQTEALTKKPIIPNLQRVSLVLTLHKAGTSALCLFANQLGGIPARGYLYHASIFLEGEVVASYDFNEKITGNQVPDHSGHNRTATLYGGTWITN